jgi:uncharacterized protein (DUF433 family)
VLRVGGTRVTVDTVVHAYASGASAEEIALAYDSLVLVDVHAVISFYLSNREPVEAYLLSRRKAGDEAVKQFPPTQSWDVLRARLVARRDAGNIKDAAIAQI